MIWVWRLALAGVIIYMSWPSDYYAGMCGSSECGSTFFMFGF
jgi:hypothetical protein